MGGRGVQNKKQGPSQPAGASSVAHGCRDSLALQVPPARHPPSPTLPVAMVTVGIPGCGLRAALPSPLLLALEEQAGFVRAQHLPAAVRLDREEKRLPWVPLGPLRPGTGRQSHSRPPALSSWGSCQPHPGLTAHSTACPEGGGLRRPSVGDWGGILFLGDPLGVSGSKLSQAGVASGAAQACGYPLALLVCEFHGFLAKGRR